MSKEKETLDAAYVRLGIPQDSSNKEINEVFAEKKAALLATLGQVRGTREQSDILAQVTEVNNAYKVIDTSMDGVLSTEAKQHKQAQTEEAKPQVKATIPQVKATIPPVDISQNHYTTLGLKPGASLTREQAQAEYIKAQSAPTGEVESRIKAINVIGDPEKKAAYDAERANAMRAKTLRAKLTRPIESTEVTVQKKAAEVTAQKEAAYARIGVPEDSSNKDINEAFVEKKAALQAALWVVKEKRDQDNIEAQITEVEKAYATIDKIKEGQLSAEAKKQQILDQKEAAKPVVNSTEKTVEQDHYKVLGLKEGTSLTSAQAQDERDKAYYGEIGKIEERMRAIEVLSNPKKKTAYDAERAKLAKSAEVVKADTPTVAIVEKPAEKSAETVVPKKIRSQTFNKIKNFISDAVGYGAPSNSPVNKGTTQGRQQ